MSFVLPRIDHITKTLRETMRVPMTSVTIHALPGDASNRRYYRLTLHATSPDVPTSMILMQVAAKEAFKQSEEAVSASVITIDELPFINVRDHLARFDLPVPRLYHYAREDGLVYLEDFGDTTLARAVGRASQEQIREYYIQAVDLLVGMQKAASSQVDARSPCLAFGRAFDAPLLTWEFNHFIEYGVVARNGRVMCADDWLPIQAEFRKISDFLARQPQVFTHRDYHSRNLMVTDHGFGLLDFQDALLGPASYDLASLLRDAYTELEESLIDELIDRFLTQANQETDRTEFRRIFDFTSIQRNLKAAGRFVYIDRVKNNPKFLTDIPRTLGYVRRNLVKYPDLSILQKHLAPYVPELA